MRLEEIRWGVIGLLLGAGSTDDTDLWITRSDGLITIGEQH